MIPKGEFPKILIVDDDSQNLSVLVEALRGEYQCLIAKDGQEALKVARKALPDTILLDIMMPGMNGFEVCKSLKSIQETEAIPVIFVTALTDEEEERKGLETGGADFIRKPFRFPILKARVKHHVDSKLKNEALKSVLEKNRELVHILCHDLVNPMFAMKNLLYVLDPSQEECFKKQVLMMQDSCDLGLEIIQMVRNFRKLEEKNENLSLVPVQLMKVLSSSLTVLLPRLQEKKITLELKISPRDWVYGHEPLLIHTIFSNLLSNAIKFSYPGNKITLQSEDDANRVRISIQDLGVGIPPDLLSQLFDLSKSTTRPGTEQERGTGFGLPLVKKTLEYLGGEIRIQSKVATSVSSDHGTTVILDLKKAPPGDIEIDTLNIETFQGIIRPV